MKRSSIRSSLFACAALLFLSLPAQARTYTIDEAVNQALGANPNIKAAEKSEKASESALKVARGDFGPSVNAAYIIKHDRMRRSPTSVSVPVGTVDVTIPTPAGAVTQPMPYTRQVSVKNNSNLTTRTAAITVSQTLFAGFRLLNAAQKAALEVEYQKQQVENARLKVANGVQSLFLKYLMAEEQVKSSQRSLERAKEQMNTARAAFNLGLRPKLDVLQAELDYANTEAKLIASENDLTTTAAQLAMMLNDAESAGNEFVGKLDLIPFDLGFEQCVQKAFAQRPDIQMAVKSLEKMEKDLGIVKGTFLPQVTAELSFSNTDADGNYHIAGNKTAVSSDVTDFSGTITIGWNLFSSGKRYNGVKQAKAGVEAMQAQVEQAYNNAAFEVKSNLLNLQDARRTCEVTEHQLASARQAYSDAKLRYELQLGTNLEMLTAQSNYAAAELNVISARCGYLVALSNLYTSMGEIHPDLH